MVEGANDFLVLRAIVIESKARRSGLHAAAFAGVFVFCFAISSIPLPSISSDAELGSIAYGYMGFPLMAAAIVAHWLENPVQPFVNTATDQVARSAVASGIVVVAILVLSSACIGWMGGGIEASQISLENGLWVAAIVLGLRRWLEPSQSAICVFVYGAVGLFLPSIGVFVINRDSNIYELAGGIIVIGSLLVAILYPRTRKFLI
ncbi:MAG: hypothetical protein E6Q27_07485 [Aeromicrobium sp.]|nr:MAG: hypothetical protein E6Q27_07485 [Aeromicrobium sp.]